MPQIKFAPISKETQIPGTNYSIQIGVIQNHDRSWGVKLSQAGKAIAAKRIKKLIDVEIVGVIRDTIGKKVALDTFELGTTMSNLLRETYEKIKSKQKQATAQKPTPAPKPAPAPQPVPAPAPQLVPAPAPQPVPAPAPQPVPAPAPQPVPAPQPAAQPSPAPIPQPENQSKIESALADMRIPTGSSDGGSSDSFWSAYSNVSTTEEVYSEPQPAVQQPVIQQPVVQQPVIQQPAQPAPTITPQTPSTSDQLDDALGILGVKCANCGSEVDPDKNTCPFCGQPL